MQVLLDPRSLYFPFISLEGGGGGVERLDYIIYLSPYSIQLFKLDINAKKQAISSSCLPTEQSVFL